MGVESVGIRFLQPPFGTAPAQRRAKRPKSSLLPDPETTAECNKSRSDFIKSINAAQSYSQMSLHIHSFNKLVAWEYSIYKAKCQVCKTVGTSDLLLFCDLCNLATHTYCLTPVLNKVPEGEWFCSECQIHLGMVK